jgi:alpha-acetolactate decarboxylase
LKLLRAAQLAVSVIGIASASLTVSAGIGKFSVEAFGNFKRMSHTGDLNGKVKLADVSGNPTTYGLGALAGLRGEVLVWEGRAMVTRGHDPQGRIEPAAATDEATLLVIGSVARWEEIAVPADMKQPEFEAFVVGEAGRRGLPASAPFPFAIRGAFPRVRWHVVTGSAAAGAGHGGDVHVQGHAQNRVFDQRRIAAVALGFYSGDELEGVISHPGQRFHLHISNAKFTWSGHIDEYEIRKGAKLLLPAQ